MPTANTLDAYGLAGSLACIHKKQIQAHTRPQRSAFLLVHALLNLLSLGLQFLSV